jgi:CO/xanthine dehydrogenase Mo-binding subunit
VEIPRVGRSSSTPGRRPRSAAFAAESGTIGAPAAIADALAPLGIEPTELPLTPDRIFALITSRGGF